MFATHVGIHHLALTCPPKGFNNIIHDNYSDISMISSSTHFGITCQQIKAFLLPLMIRSNQMWPSGNQQLTAD